MPAVVDAQDNEIRDLEIFSVGTHNGKEFSREDLESIVEAFNELRDQIQPPLKLGHHNTPAMRSGKPAVGWITELALEGNKLVAKQVKRVPDKVIEAVNKRHYNQVSSEILRDFKTNDGREFDMVLVGVALLGSELPAVKNLDDISELAEFSSNEEDISEFTMDIEEYNDDPEVYGENLRVMLLDRLGEMDENIDTVASDLAEDTDFSKSAYIDAMNGNTKCPDREIIDNIAKAVQIDEDELVRVANSDGCSYDIEENKELVEFSELFFNSEIFEFAVHKPDWSGKDDSKWNKPDLEDFDTDDLGEIDDHFIASISRFPPENFTDLKLPVVGPDGTLNENAVESAARLVGQTEGIDTERARSVIENLQEEFEEDSEPDENTSTGGGEPSVDFEEVQEVISEMDAEEREKLLGDYLENGDEDTEELKAQVRQLRRQNYESDVDDFIDEMERKGKLVADQGDKVRDILTSYQDPAEYTNSPEDTLFEDIKELFSQLNPQVDTSEYTEEHEGDIPTGGELDDKEASELADEIYEA